MRTVWVSLILVMLVSFFCAANAAAHCEIPCGIYDDSMRIKIIAEHLATIEKSMKEIMELSRQTPVDYNQLVRWISNKEAHANEIQHIVSQYFMTQRIKLDTKDYLKKLAVLHKMLVHAMKCKQTIDLSHVATLRSLLSEFESPYFGHGHD
jgi:nickel superoxide dismutase